MTTAYYDTATGGACTGIYNTGGTIWYLASNTTSGGTVAFYSDPNDYAGSLVSAFFAKLAAVMQAFRYTTTHPDDSHKQAIQARLMEKKP